VPYDAITTIYNRSHQKLADLEFTASVQRSFVLNGIGQARIITSAKSPLYAAGILDVGNLVVITSTAGIQPWGGWIVHIDQTHSALTVTCKEMAYIFSRRRLGKSEFFPYNTPTDLAKQLTAQTSPFVIASPGNADTSAPLSKEFHFTGGAAALRRLPNDTGVDWWIEMLPNGQGILHTGNRGTDKSQTVIFSEGPGGNIADDVTYTRDGEAMINDVVFVGRGDGAWQRAPHVERADHAAITQYGLYQATNVRYDVIHAANLEEVSRRYLERNSRPRETLDFHVANVGGIWGNFSEGDLVTVELPSFGPTGLTNLPCRVIGREIDETSTTPVRALLEVQ
jgi:hypothetical protein